MVAAMDTSLSDTSSDELTKLYTKENKQWSAYKRTVVPRNVLQDFIESNFDAPNFQYGVTYKELYAFSSTSDTDSNASSSKERGPFIKGGKLIYLRFPCRCSGCSTGIYCKCVCTRCDGYDLPKCRCKPCKVKRKEALSKLIGPIDVPSSIGKRPLEMDNAVMWRSNKYNRMDQ